LRGGLDVPKERWISYPGAERGADGSLVIAWAGWNPLQHATALAAHYLELKDSEGWEPARLQPLLAGLLELLPWLEQWHNAIDPVYGERMGAYYRGFSTKRPERWGSPWMTSAPGNRPLPLPSATGKKRDKRTKFRLDILGASIGWRKRRWQRLMKTC
jgi:hypothetical protein